MRLVTLRTAAGTRAARVDGDEAVELAYPDVAAALAAHPDLRGLGNDGLVAAGAVRHPLAGADLAPLVPRPSKVFCLGLNYAGHIQEMGRERPGHPALFGKFPLALIGARDDLVLPAVSERVDWEVELCLVIGRPVRHAGPDEAAAIAGYTVANDISMRDWQRRTTQFLQGKTFEHSTPVGPALVTLDELPGGGSGPRAALRGRR
jgi:acylpyruvate hydrolase